MAVTLSSSAASTRRTSAAVRTPPRLVVASLLAERIVVALRRRPIDDGERLRLGVNVYPEKRRRLPTPRRAHRLEFMHALVELPAPVCLVADLLTTA